MSPKPPSPPRTRRHNRLLTGGSSRKAEEAEDNGTRRRSARGFAKAFIIFARSETAGSVLFAEELLRRPNWRGAKLPCGDSKLVLSIRATYACYLCGSFTRFFAHARGRLLLRRRTGLNLTKGPEGSWWLPPRVNFQGRRVCCRTSRRQRLLRAENFYRVLSRKISL